VDKAREYTEGRVVEGTAAIKSAGAE
jgi:hypothetical protein